MKVAFVINDSFSAHQFFGGLLRHLIESGHEVHVVSPADDDVAVLDAWGVHHHDVAFNRFGAGIGECRVVLSLYRLFRQTKFDVVHTVTIKPNVYATIAARLAGTPTVVAHVEGLGFAFQPDTRGVRARVRAIVGRALMAIGFVAAHRVLFVNDEDPVLLVRWRMLQRSKVVRLPAAVDVQRYDRGAIADDEIDRVRKEIGFEASEKVVLLAAARMVWPKGVREFLEVARTQASVDRRFLLIGPTDPGSPDAIDRELLESAPGVTWLEFRRDLPTFMAMADIVVLPTYYREGMPRTLMEAMALGTAVVASDSVGCRDLVTHEVTGLLVAPKDSDDLGRAVARLLDDDELRERLARAGAAEIRATFAEEKVAPRMLRELYGWTE